MRFVVLHDGVPPTLAAVARPTDEFDGREDPFVAYYHDVPRELADLLDSYVPAHIR